MLRSIAPILITFNEEKNIDQTLSKLKWAKMIVLVDSFSDDKTLEIAKKYNNVAIFQRRFDDFASQRNFALSQVPVEAEWVLYMDADYIMTDKLIEEIDRITCKPDVNAFIVSFKYCIFNKPLKASLYPSKKILFRKNKGIFIQEGHHEVLHIDGKAERLKAVMLHDDRKSLHRWLQGQLNYAQLEADRLSSLSNRELCTFDRIRKVRILAPLLILPYCLFCKGLILDGWGGFYYTLERLTYEVVLSLFLFHSSFKPERPKE
jgi:glycosyltransferase involved in cell wall biosynthesis